MIVRIGTVLKVFPADGKVQVTFEDTGSSSLPLPMMAYGQEYAMPKVGDDVITLHLQNGSSKGVCLGRYYGNGNEPKASSGYRKDFDDDAYIECNNGEFKIDADKVILKCSYKTVTLEDLIKRIERLEELLSLPNTI